MDISKIKELITEKKTETENKLHEKYGIDFVVTAVGKFATYITGPAYAAQCHPADDEALFFETMMYEQGKTMKDKYREALLAEAMKERMSKPVSEIAKEFAFVMDFTTLADDYEKGMDPKQYNSENNCTFYTVLAINTDAECNIEPEPLYNALCAMYKELGPVNGGIRLYLADEDEFADIKEFSMKNRRIDSDLLQMCEGSFFATVENSEIKEDIEEMKNILY